MERCGASGRDGCTRPATWKQDVYSGAGDRGRFIYHAYWCDEHAENIVQRRRREWLAPPHMDQMVSKTL